MTIDINKVVVFDLETIADKSMIDTLPEPKPNGNLKDAVKIAADIAAKKEAQIQGMGLNPATSRICCFGWRSTQAEGTVILGDGNAETDGYSAILLRAAWDRLARFEHFVTFNGRSFDVPTMTFHSIRHSVKIPVVIDAGRYNRSGSNHTDMRQVLAGSDQFASGKLDFFVRALLGRDPIGKTEGMEGNLVQHYWDMGLTEDIAKYCLGDCQDTWDLFERCLHVGAI